MSRAEESGSLAKSVRHNRNAAGDDGGRLERIVFIGRTFDEYMRMFALEAQDIAGLRILDCPSGACSFAAAAHQLGSQVTSADIAYYHDAEKLYEKGLQDVVHAMEHVEAEKHRYIWSEFQSVADLHAERLKALEACHEDMRLQPERYVPVTLPSLPFEDEQFDLTLSAHFLFMYADRLSEEFHRLTLRELLRVTRRELRIFPIVDQTGRSPALVESLIALASAQGFAAEIQQVPYHFQKNANQVLILQKR
ncbi:SAM-dependent methyltransferase [Paenibacillus chibensis]|uniref:SAM-dependent methyltransferase n=1 Tax=Paenibacillus chibensis TaxID=59846 RepID=A0ABU6PVH7_9BACL|nr:SAM-dependent methyltransferase [Paenibacillus chibensis]